jgi:hypothetical protein
MDAGITAGVGDTSWPHLRNQANPWQAQVLSVADNQTIDGAPQLNMTGHAQATHPLTLCRRIVPGR